MILRTSAIDRLIGEVLGAGVDTVLNLGAGLDARPYRMRLPASLHWVEMDFPTIIEQKNLKLSGYQPVCELERIGIDLLDLTFRDEILARYTTTANNTLVITEGLLTYFSSQDAASLASELRATPSIRYWIQDFDNASRGRLPRGWAEKLKAAPPLFQVRDWFEFFEEYGWQASHVITTFEESQRINRPYPLDFPFGFMARALPKSVRKKIQSLTGAVLMQRIAPSIA